jgi:hypothetical protein
LGLTYPTKDDYYSIDVINENFNKVTKAVLKKDAVYVASYDSSDDDKALADYVCDEENAGTVLKTAVTNAKKYAEIVILGGTYNINESVVINKSLKIRGVGSETVLKQIDDYGETYNIFVAEAENITISNLRLEDNAVSTSPKWLIFVECNNVAVENVVFHFDNKKETDISMVHFSKDCTDGIVKYCRFVRSFSRADKKECYDITAYGNSFGGIYSANRAYDDESDFSQVRVALLSEDNYNNTAISGQNTAVYVADELKHTVSNKQEV